MKSIAGFFCFVCIVNFAAYGETALFGKPYAFSGTFQTGFSYGTSYEIVFQNGMSGEYLSELQWELKPIIFMGLELSLEPVKTGGFFTELGIKAGLPMVTGTMEDRDWDEYTPEILISFSSHTNKLKAAVLLTLDAGYSFSVTNRFFLRLFGSLDYFFFKMEGSDGYGSYYNSKNGSWETDSFYGPVCRYIQNWFLLSPGISAGFILDRLTIKGAVKITPLIFCAGEDEHPLREIRFYDYMIGIFAIEPAMDLSFTFSPHLEAGFACSYRFITGTRGATIMEPYRNSKSEYSPNAAGSGLRLFESSVYLKFVF